MRLEDETAVIRDGFPEAYADLAVAVTHLGGPTAITIIVAVLFWVGPRRESALVAGYTVAGLGLLMILKALFDMPRPPESVHLVEFDEDPYGFPSGHAFVATVVYGGLLVAYDRLREPAAVAGVVSLVVLISYTRLVLGYHYLSDVIVGAIVGAAFLAILFRFTPPDPRIGFGLGLVLVPIAAVLTGGSENTLLGMGAAIGGSVAVRYLSAIPPLRSPAEGVVLVAVGLAFLVAVSVLESAFVEPTFGLVGVVTSNTVLFAGLIFLPALVGRIQVSILDTAHS